MSLQMILSVGFKGALITPHYDGFRAGRAATALQSSEGSFTGSEIKYLCLSVSQQEV